MCYNKLHIDTSYHCRYFYSGHAHKCVFDVPCGICEECIQQVQMDYFVRMKSEYEECTRNGGRVAFLTFTYSDDNIPAYSYHYDSENKEIVFDKVNAKTSQLPFIYSFDRSNLQRFFNSYRKRFERLGVKSPFRYIVVGEYGTEKLYTQRSHFHVLLYYTSEAIRMINYLSPFCTTEQTILTDVNDLWDYGIVSDSKIHGLFISSPDACSYCSKYISKTMTLLNLRRFAIFRDFIKTHFDGLLPDGYDCKPSIDGYFRHYIKKIGSNLYTLKSKNFGKYAVEKIENYLSFGDYESAYDDFVTGYPYISNGETKYIGYSMYYYRKLCYNVRRDGSYYLNSFGMYFQKRNLKSIADTLVDLWKKIDYRLLTTTEYEFVLNFLKRTPLLQVAYYKLFVDGVCFPVHPSGCYCDIYDHFIFRNFNLTFDDLYDFRYSYLHDPLLVDTREPYGLTFGDFIASTDNEYYNHCCISDYSLFINLASRLIDKSRKCKALERKLKQDNIKYLQNINNNYIYSSLNP